jgi:hypothetical protein
MFKAGFLLAVVWAASPPPTPPIEVLGTLELPAGESDAIRKAAAAAGFQIVAIEKFEEDFFALIAGYGPAGKRPGGACRGALYALEAETLEGGKLRWQVVPFEGSPMDLSYALDAARCPAPFSSRVLVIGKVSDGDLTAILEAIRKRRVVPDESRRPIAANIGKNLVARALRLEPDGMRATVVMADAANPDQTLDVLVRKFDGAWLITDADQGVAWGD